MNTGRSSLHKCCQTRPDKNLKPQQEVTSHGMGRAEMNCDPTANQFKFNLQRERTTGKISRKSWKLQIQNKGLENQITNKCNNTKKMSNMENFLMKNFSAYHQKSSEKLWEMNSEWSLRNTKDLYHGRMNWRRTNNKVWNELIWQWRKEQTL